MPDSSTISILHVSDLHYSKRKYREQGIVIEAMTADLERLCVGHKRPDIVVFTGDLVNAAGEDSHEDAFDLFIDKVAKATGCAEERIYIVPGNHDAARKVVSAETDEHKTWRNLANDMDQLNDLYENNKFEEIANSKFAQFNELEQYLSDNTKTYRNTFVTVYNIPAINVDIVVFNTAILSSAGLMSLGEDQGKLIVPEYAVRDALSFLTKDSYKIFATHHPLKMLSENGERFLRKAIQEHSDMHLFGHMHDPLSQNLVSFEGELFSNQAGAVFTARKGSYIGYSLICVDSSTKSSMAHLRTFFNDRSAFDNAVDIVENGLFYSSQAAREFWRSIVSPVDEQTFRKFLVDDCYCALKEEPGLTDAGARNIHEMFVTPPFVSMSLQADTKDQDSAPEEKEVEFESLVNGDNNVVIFSLAEHGRTTILLELRERMLCDAMKIRFPRFPIFIDFEEIKNNYHKILQISKGRFPTSTKEFDVESLIKLGHACFIFDDVNFSDTKRMRILREFVSKYPKVRYIFSSLKNSSTPVGAHAVPEMPVHFDFVEICPLKRNQMRQLVTKYNGGGDIDSVLDRIQFEIEQINLPFTAANGSILMVIFEEFRGFRAINRSVLIEQFVDISLKKGSIEQSQRETFDYRNKTDLLAHVAAWMAKENLYIVEAEALREVIGAYIKRLGLKADLTKLIEEFFAARILIPKPDNRLCFRYRAVLEYFISLQMLTDPDFREWVIDDERYLSFTNEIQYYAGKLRKDLALINDIEERFDLILEKLEIDIGKVDLHAITKLKLPNKEKGSSSVQRLSDQLLSEPLTELERDEELEANIPRDVENRQEVFRPEIVKPGQKFIVALMLYSGILKNMELIDDGEKRRHLNKIWRGWSYFLHTSLQVASSIARERRVRINGVLYEVTAPHGISEDELSRIIALNMPKGVSSLILANLGTEKLEKQLTEPTLSEQENPLIYEFFRAGLISDLRLSASQSALKTVLTELKDSPYLLQAMIWKIADLRRYEKLPKEQYDKLAPDVAESLANLKGGTKNERSNEKRKQIERLKKDDILLRLKHLAAEK